MVGEDVVLPCVLEPPKDASQMTVEWGRPDLKPRFVFVSLHGSNNYPADQNEAYKGRTSMFPDKLKNGDISLKLSDVRHSDNGRYRCYIPNEEKEYFVNLVVGNKPKQPWPQDGDDVDDGDDGDDDDEGAIKNKNLDNTSETDNCSILKCALPSSVVGTVIGVLITIACTRIYRCTKPKQPRPQDGVDSDDVDDGDDNGGAGGGCNEGDDSDDVDEGDDGDDGAVKDGGDEREPLNTINQATGENRRLSGQPPETGTENDRTRENLNQQRNTEQLQNKEKHLKGGKREPENHKDENSKLQRNIEQLQDVNEELLDTQNEVKDLLENQKNHLAKRLQDVENKREKNKEELQLVEKTLNETKTFDEKEEVLKQKEELLQSQWKLDEEKTKYKRRLPFIESLLVQC
ncbi:hypothetical protein CHARACLAT_029170 [Characodon lateralis]|uniref:Ig-like domain-containing protein n=1 Tax=Characodon lateralis TaxID=208331 RepID=A0ABU7DKT1_9TELE|nr:hypothetical protein [Characodon lateralis]